MVIDDNAKYFTYFEMRNISSLILYDLRSLDFPELFAHLRLSRKHDEKFIRIKYFTLNLLLH